MTQSEYFKNSVVRSADGHLLPVYHGTGNLASMRKEIQMDKFCGQGEDQYGRGVYFTTSYEMALGYTTPRNQLGEEKLGGEDDPGVLECYLNICNPLRVKAVEHANLRNIFISGPQAYKVLLRDKRLYLPLNGDGSGEMNPLWDFFDMNGALLREDEAHFRPFIQKLVREYFSPTDLLHLDVFWGGDDSTGYLAALRDILGYDGVCVEFDNQYHWIAWFPEQIKLVDNLDPQVSPFPAD